MVFRSFTSVVAQGQSTDSGLTGQISAMLADATGNQAVLHTTILSDTPTSAVISGRDATLHIDGPFFMPGPFTLTRHRGHPEDPGRILHYDEKPGTQAGGLHNAAAEAARLIADGITESEIRHAHRLVRGVAASYRNALGYFVDALYARGTIGPDVSEALKAQAVAEAAPDR
jgi:hypothetical protein